MLQSNLNLFRVEIASCSVRGLMATRVVNCYDRVVAVSHALVPFSELIQGSKARSRDLLTFSASYFESRFAIKSKPFITMYSVFRVALFHRETIVIFMRTSIKRGKPRAFARGFFPYFAFASTASKPRYLTVAVVRSFSSLWPFFLRYQTIEAIELASYL